MLRGLAAVTCAASLSFAPLVSADDWTAADVKKIQDAVAAGRPVQDGGSIAGQVVQVVWFAVGVQLVYVIDLRAQLCFVHGTGSLGDSLAPVPCAAVKKGYPLFAPLITWEQ